MLFMQSTADLPPSGSWTERTLLEQFTFTVWMSAVGTNICSIPVRSAQAKGADGGLGGAAGGEGEAGGGQQLTGPRSGP